MAETVPTVVNLGSARAIPMGQGRCYVVDGKEIAVFRQRDGRLFATENRCPHRQGPLAEGLVGNGKVVCPLHSHQFNLKTGEGSEHTECVRTYPVDEIGGEILIESPEPLRVYAAKAQKESACKPDFKVSIPENRTEDHSRSRQRILWLSTAAFTLLFNVWLMLGVLGIAIRKDLGLSDSRLEWLIAAAILSGAVLRLNFGILAEKFGSRRVMGFLLLGVAVPVYLFSLATTYSQLMICAILFGISGNSFSAGIAWNSAWFPQWQKGRALGIFGAGNVGAAGTKLLVIFAPGLLTAVPVAGYLGGFIPGGWRFIPVLYAALLVLTGIAIFRFCPKEDLKPGSGRSLRETLSPLTHARVWRFGLYYIVVFGAYVALSAWLPKFYVDTYGLPLAKAAMLTATFIIPASLLRPLGGYLSDRFGPRVVTYAVFAAITAVLCILSLPNGKVIFEHSAAASPMVLDYRINIWTFATLMFLLACAMGIGKASVYKYIPDYFPNDVGAVGGIVGMLGALGGFFLPPAFGALGRWSGVPQMAFLSLLALSVGSLVWLHLVVLKIRSAKPKVENETREVATASL